MMAWNLQEWVGWAQIVTLSLGTCIDQVLRSWGSYILCLCRAIILLHSPVMQLQLFNTRATMMKLFFSLLVVLHPTKYRFPCKGQSFTGWLKAWSFKLTVSSPWAVTLGSTIIYNSYIILTTQEEKEISMNNDVLQSNGIFHLGNHP